MKIFGTIFFIVVVCIMILGGVAAIVDHIRVIKRAQKIDPTVRTSSEADHVLKREIAQNVSNLNKETNKVYCKHCGASIDADSKFCKICGKEQ